ncbi:MAG: hypothetical protein AVDCRST_MAG39-50 [uncultured Sphingomonadaceae bacterium]|uniref:Uncharacterized protein n=1 Tax=uncultured Sphingomonadaceae bacterium TaxID=169976 RepID=A0A6J4RU32_9SPHN|nr:MAG: hypothetical protein AVDCRST_MAG39-50 [uncultured Sphingomonadaceae bacterium]
MGTVIIIVVRIVVVVDEIPTDQVVDVAVGIVVRPILPARVG